MLDKWTCDFFIFLKSHNIPASSIPLLLYGESKCGLSDLSKVTHLGSIDSDPGHLIPGLRPFTTVLYEPMAVASDCQCIRDMKMVVLLGLFQGCSQCREIRATGIELC